MKDLHRIRLKRKARCFQLFWEWYCCITKNQEYCGNINGFAAYITEDFFFFMALTRLHFQRFWTPEFATSCFLSSLSAKSLYLTSTWAKNQNDFNVMYVFDDVLLCPRLQLPSQQVMLFVRKWRISPISVKVCLICVRCRRRAYWSQNHVLPLWCLLLSSAPIAVFVTVFCGPGQKLISTQFATLADIQNNWLKWGNSRDDQLFMQLSYNMSMALCSYVKYKFCCCW